MTEVEKVTNVMVGLLDAEIAARGGEDTDQETAYLAGVRDAMVMMLDAKVGS